MEKLIITKNVRDAIVKIIAESTLPTNQGVQIINALNSLTPLEATKETKEPKK